MFFQKRQDLILPDISGNANHGVGSADNAFILFFDVLNRQ